MIRVFLVAFALWILASLLIFGYRKITKDHADQTGKLVLAGVISFTVSALVFVLEKG